MLFHGCQKEGKRNVIACETIRSMNISQMFTMLNYMYYISCYKCEIFIKSLLMQFAISAALFMNKKQSFRSVRIYLHICIYLYITGTQNVFFFFLHKISLTGISHFLNVRYRNNGFLKYISGQNVIAKKNITLNGNQENTLHE